MSLELLFCVCLSGTALCVCCCVTLWPGAWSSPYLKETALNLLLQDLRAKTELRRDRRGLPAPGGHLQTRLHCTMFTRLWRFVTAWNADVWKCNGTLFKVLINTINSKIYNFWHFVKNTFEQESSCGKYKQTCFWFLSDEYFQEGIWPIHLFSGRLRRFLLFLSWRTSKPNLSA